MLIVPIKAAGGKDTSVTVLADYLARNLDEDGRVVPIVWGLTDPIFRDAAYSGKLGKIADAPALPDALQAARKLNAAYLLVYTTHFKGAFEIGTCQLFDDGKEIWKDTEQMSSSGTASGVDSRSDSMARTWTLKLGLIPLKGLPARPKMNTPAVGQGQAPIHPETTPPPPVEATPEKFDPALVAAHVQKLREDGKLDAALVMVRDNIDVHPLEPSLRVLLVQILEAQGNYRMAAEEAQRGSQMVPGNRELKMAAIRDLLQAGEADLAKSALNEMLARGDQDPSTVLLEGQIALAAHDLKEASVCFGKAVQAAPSPEGFYWQAVSRALLGGEDGVTLDLQSLTKTPLPNSALIDAYPVAIKLVSDSTSEDLNQVLTVFSQASLKGSVVGDQINDMARRSAARSAFLSASPIPPEHKDSNAKRLLAQKLLSLALIDLQDFVKTGSDDSMTDARINLGEAMKQSKAAQDAYAAEIGTSRNASASIHTV